MKNVGVIIPAGGVGKRFGGDAPKQYMDLDGVPIIIRTLMNFERCEDIGLIIVSVAKEQITHIKSLLLKYEIKKVKNIVIGGSERIYSINNALRSEHIQNCDIVLVHDAVRPFARRKLITEVIKNSEKYGAAIPGMNLNETIKSYDNDNFVDQTIDRSRFKAIQTPQGFKTSILIEAYENAINNGIFGTDDASLVEHIGKKIKIIPGSHQNIKITTPFDMSVAKEILKDYIL